MNVLVAYASHHGATAEIADRIAAVLTGRGHHVSLEQADRVRDVRGFDAFVIGSALYCGWLKEAKDLVQKNKATVARLPLWLFSSGPLGASEKNAQGSDIRVVPKDIVELGQAVGARDHHVFFGSYDPSAKPIGFLEKTFKLVPSNAAILEAGDFRDWGEIGAWATGIAEDLAAPAEN